MNRRIFSKKKPEYTPKFIQQVRRQAAKNRSNPCITVLCHNKYSLDKKKEKLAKQSLGYFYCLENRNVSYISSKENKIKYLKSKLYHRNQFLNTSSSALCFAASNNEKSLQNRKQQAPSAEKQDEAVTKKDHVQRFVISRLKLIKYHKKLCA